MVACCVCGLRSRCKNDPEEKDIPLYRFPSETDAERREKWILNVKRDDLPTDPRLCAKHFTEDQFEIDRKVCSFVIMYYHYHRTVTEKKILNIFK